MADGHSFVDEALIEVSSGAGGNGCVSFRREKFVPYGGSDGGDGGHGGDVVLAADSGLTTLQFFRQRRHLRADDGANGTGANKTGASARDELDC